MMQETPPPQLEYGTAVPRSRKVWMFAAVATLPFMWVIWLINPLLWPSRVRVTYSWQICASHLRQIGQGMLLYSNEYKGAYPDSFARLIQLEDCEPEIFVCGSSNDTPARGPNLQVVLNSFAQPGHCSYTYLGSGLTIFTVSPDTVVAYETLSNHSDPGAAVLFGDGAVHIVDQQWMAQLEAKLKARGPTTMPIVLPPADHRRF